MTGSIVAGITLVFPAISSLWFFPRLTGAISACTNNDMCNYQVANPNSDVAITLHVTGDEWEAHEQDVFGYSVMLDQRTNEYKYAVRRTDGRLDLSPYPVINADPKYTIRNFDLTTDLAPDPMYTIMDCCEKGMICCPRINEAEDIDFDTGGYSFAEDIAALEDDNNWIMEADTLTTVGDSIEWVTDKDSTTASDGDAIEWVTDTSITDSEIIQWTMKDPSFSLVNDELSLSSSVTESPSSPPTRRRRNRKNHKSVIHKNANAQKTKKPVPGKKKVVLKAKENDAIPKAAFKQKTKNRNTPKNKKPDTAKFAKHKHKLKPATSQGGGRTNTVKILKHKHKHKQAPAKESARKKKTRPQSKTKIKKPDKRRLQQQQTQRRRLQLTDIPGPLPFPVLGPGVPHTAQQQPVKGQIRNLVLMLRWSNHRHRTLPSESDIDILFNNVGYNPLCPTGSVRDVFLKNSYNKLTLDSVVVRWVDMDNTEAYYANGNRGLTTRIHKGIFYALDYVDRNGLVNFADFDRDGDGMIDAITFLHSGYGSEWGGVSSDGAYFSNRIWSHKWGLYTDGQSFTTNGWQSRTGVKVIRYHMSPAIWGRAGSEIGRVGVISHETGHFLGITDLYDGTGGMGLGSYDLMANSWGFDGSQYYPPLLSAWTKIQLGWINPTVITKPGTYEIQASADTPEVYKITEGYPEDEYLLIENRQRLHYDVTMPQGGLAIYHVDDTAGWSDEGYPGQTGWPQNGKHYRVALIQADGLFHLETGTNRGDNTDLFSGDGIDELGLGSLNKPYPNTDAYQNGIVYATGNRIHSISPSAEVMTFCFKECAPGYPTRDPTRGRNTDATRPPTTKEPTISPTSEPTHAPSRTPTKRPTREPTKSPTRIPTNYPTQKPLPPTNPPRTIINSPKIEYMTLTPTSGIPRGELETPKSTTGYYRMKGYMFDITAMDEITISNIKIHTLFNENAKKFITVYAKEGSFWDSKSEDDWKMLGRIATTGSGYGNYKALPKGSLRPYRLLPKMTYALYIHCEECFLLATPGKGGYDKIYVSSDELFARNGRGMLDLFGQSLRRSYNWSGAIEYTIEKRR